MFRGSEQRHRRISSIIAIFLAIGILPIASMSPASALPPTISSLSNYSSATSGGSLSTITGTNLSGATSVTVGGASAVIGSNTATSLEFTIPAGSIGTQSVVVTTPDGSVTSTTSITYYATLTPACSVSGFFTIQNNTVISHSNCAGNAVIPSGVKTIGSNSFVSNANRYFLDIPATVTSIATVNNFSPFRSSNLQGVTFQPNSQLTSLQGGTFRSLPRLQYLSLPSSITSMAALTFSDTWPGAGIRWLEIPATLTGIDTSTPYGALSHEVPLTCIITPVGSVARSLAGRFTVGWPSQTSVGAANPIFVTSVNDCPAPTVSSISTTSGSGNGGTSLTLTGTNLWNVTGVSIGGSAATITSWPSTTSVVVRTPGGTTGAKSIVLTTPGPTLNATQTFTYLAPPVITSITPSSGSVGGGETLTITGTDLSSISSVKIGGISATSLRSNTSTSITVTTPAGIAGAQNVVVTNAVDSSTAVAGYTYVEQISSFSNFSLFGSVTTANFGTPISISATVAYASRITFLYGSKRIPGCISVRTPANAPFTVTCNWRPARRGAERLSAVAVPISAGVSTGYSAPINVRVNSRSTTR